MKNILKAPFEFLWSLVPKGAKKWLGNKAEAVLVGAIAGRIRAAIEHGGESMEGKRSQIVAAIIAGLGGVKLWAHTTHPEWVQWIDLTIGILAGVFGITMAAKVERGNKDAAAAAGK